MDDLISRNAAIDAIVSETVHTDADYIKNLCQNPANSEDWLGGVCAAINAVEDVNAVDAVPVVHGRWTTNKYGETVCSECNNNALQVLTGCLVNRHFEPHKSKFCPNCGAKMDGERRDERADD